jgi:hypothetical protein
MFYFFFLCFGVGPHAGCENGWNCALKDINGENAFPLWSACDGVPYTLATAQVLLQSPQKFGEGRSSEWSISTQSQLHARRELPSIKAAIKRIALLSLRLTGAGVASESLNPTNPWSGDCSKK